MSLVNLGGGSFICQELDLKPGRDPNSTNYAKDFDVVGYVSYEEMPDGLKRIERTKEEYEAQ